MRQSKIENVLAWIVKCGLWAIPFLPLYVSGSMLFPFITGKNFAFRIAVEIIFALWVGLAVARPEYRPKLTSIFKTVTVFVAIIFFADLLGLHPYRSFFSNYERMEGFMMLGHLYLYFIVLVSVFKSRRDWLVFFHSSLAASLIVSFIALQQKLGYRVSLQGGYRVDSTIGNPAYLAAYLLFHVWFLLLLIYGFRKNIALVFFYVLALFFELAIIYFTATRGVVLALAAAAILFAFLIVLFWDRIFPLVKSRRKWAIAALVIIILMPLFFWMIRGTAFVRSTPALKRLTNYSLSERTIQSRFMIWKMSAKAVMERPILGWGQENYYLVFQKYYNPGLYSQEPWFDRSHNVFFDWAVHGGILGLLSYLSIFAAALWGIVRGMRRNLFATWQGLVIIVLLVSYFFQNLFVFDNLNTYILFFAVLAYIEYILSFGTAKPTEKKINKPGFALPVFVVLFGLMAAITGGYFLNLKPIKESKALIQVLKIYGAPDLKMSQLMDAYQKALSFRSFGDTEVREQLANMARGVLDDSRFTPDEKKKFMEFAIDELKKETSYPAKDVKHLLFLGSLMNRAVLLNPAYAVESEIALQEAARLSPTKQPVYFELAQFYLSTGNIEKAAESLETAWKLDKSYGEAAANLWFAGVLAKKPEIVAEVKTRFSLDNLSENNLLKIGAAYQRVGDYASAFEVYERLVKIAPQNAAYRAVFAALLAINGRIDEARSEAEEAARLDPVYQEEAGRFIKSLKQK